jgi:hypothetical protein
LMGCASTRARSDFEVRGEAGLLTFIGLSHTEDVANLATRGVPNHHHPPLTPSKTNKASSKSRPRSASVRVRFAWS